MDKHPKRKISKDNPYKLIYDEINSKFKMSFKDSRNELQTIEVDKSIYKVFDESELIDISQMHKDNNHIDFRRINISESIDISISHKIIANQKSIEDEIIDKLQNEDLYQAINSLPFIQKQRIKKYFFEEKTLQEIADEEQCSARAIKYSIDIGIQKLKEILKK